MSSVEQGTRESGERRNARREIVAASERFLRERPYRELTIELLTTDIGVTDAEFHELFEGVTEVVLALVTELGNQLYGLAERWLQDAQIEQEAELGINTAARVWLRAIVDFCYRNGTILRTVNEAAFTDERIERAYNGFLDRFTELTAFGLEHMIKEGRIEPLDPWPVARALNLMNERYLVAEFGRGADGNPDEALKTLETIWLRALAPAVVERREH